MRSGAAAPDRMELAEGLVVELLERGLGHYCEPGDAVLLHYRVVLDETGMEVDSTHATGGPQQIQLGRTPVIQGLERGLTGLRVGTRARIHVPSALGYGEKGMLQNGIPGDASLTLEVQVLRVR